MHSGPELGKRLAEAIKLKRDKNPRLTQSDIAKAFGVGQGSVSEWTKFGRISKKHLTTLVEFFSDVVGPEHWGLPAPSQTPQTLTNRQRRIIDLAGMLSESAQDALIKRLEEAQKAIYEDGPGLGGGFPATGTL